MAFSAILLLCTAVPVAAGGSIAKAKHGHAECHGKGKKPVAVVTQVRKAPALTTVVLKSAGGGSSHWMPIASDLMP